MDKNIKRIDERLGDGIEFGADKNLLFEKKIVPEYVPTRLAAHYLGVSENALRIKVCRGQVPAYKLGRSLRFRVSELVGLLKKGGQNGN